jgi:hypothetical protein
MFLSRTLGVGVAFALLGVPAEVRAQAPAQPASDRSVAIPRVATPPLLVDYLDGVPRAEEAAVKTFVQREPGDGIPASQSTEAYLSYDDANLYVIFVARDREPAKIRASLTRREGFGNDDHVGVLLDTFGDRRRSYLFIVNPLGVQLDGVTTEGAGDDDFSFDTVWQSDGQLTPFGFVVRMAIPFKSLRFSTANEQRWGIALARAIRRNNETSFWPYITRRVASVGQQLATATGLQQISAGRNMQFIPYGAFTRARFLDEERPGFVNDADGRAGIDGKIVVKDAFTLDLTLNPDFSQVESDEPQVTINQRFEVFFPEKRPFFIENASYFETPINLFFSRRIADPQQGARITGKAGDWAIAGLLIDDRAPGRRVGPDDPARGDRAGVGVVRLQRDLPNQSAIGMLATTSQFAGSHSNVAAVDGRYKLSDTWVAWGQAAFSDTKGLDGASRSGPALTVTLDRTGRNWGAFFLYEDIGRDFSAPLGFVQRVDLRRLRPFIRYTWFPEKGALVSIRPEVSGEALWDHDGSLNDWEGSAELQVELKGQTSVEAGYNETMERFEGAEFRKRAASFTFETAWLTWLESSFEYDRGQEINFFPSEELPPFLANATETELSVTLKPMPRLRLDQTYLFTRLSTRQQLSGLSRSGVIVDNHIWRSRASYQFTRNLSLRAILDYSSVLPDSSLIDLETEKDFTADLLATYLVNPWTALYVGYTDGYGNRVIDPVSRDRLRVTDSAFHSIGRQVFVKMSYLLRF